MISINRYHKIFLAVAAVAAMGLTSCDKPEEDVSLLELYTSGFVKQYGIPDPEQDWNMAEESELTIYLAEPASRVNAYVYAGTEYYRVGEFYNVPAGEFPISVDIPEKSKIMVITVDGYAFWAEPGSYVDTSTRVSKSSRDGEDDETYPDGNITLNSSMTAKQIFGKDEEEINSMGWIVLVEDLGAQDDFDFNDVVFRIECVSTNLTVLSKDWNVIDQETVNVLKAPASGASREGGTSETGETRKITVTALAAGGTLPIYLHFQTAEATPRDFILTPWASKIDTEQEDYILRTTSFTASQIEQELEWHSWFYASGGGTALKLWKEDGETTYQMLNTRSERLKTTDSLGNAVQESGVSGLTGKSVSILLTEEWFGSTFSMTRYSGIKVDGSMNFVDVNGFFITVNTITPTSESSSIPINPDAHTSTIATNWNTEEILSLTSPQMLLIPDLNISGSDNIGFRWPMERIRIDKVYTNFANWVGAVETYADWYQSPSTGWYQRGTETTTWTYDTTWTDSTD